MDVEITGIGVDPNPLGYVYIFYLSQLDRGNFTAMGCMQGWSSLVNSLSNSVIIYFYITKNLESINGNADY